MDGSVLAVFAHPDDETLLAGGVLAACAAAGRRVSIVSMTRGERGPTELPGFTNRRALGDAREAELLAGAAALLYPITYPEPFGLVMVESMACGTPVAAFGVGAVPEIVEQGVGGSWVSPGEDLGEAVQSAVQLDRRGVRQAAVERFDYRRMVDAYERLYRRPTRPSDHAG